MTIDNLHASWSIVSDVCFVRFFSAVDASLDAPMEDWGSLHESSLKRLHASEQ